AVPPGGPHPDPPPRAGEGNIRHFGERAPESLDVGVPPFQPPALPTDGVDRADATGQRIELIEQGDHHFFVGDGDVRAEDPSLRTDVRDRRGKVIASDLPNQVAAIDL